MNRCVFTFPLALALIVAGGLRADAQTVIVQSAPARSTIEASMNGRPPVSAAADSFGDATLVLPGNMSEGVVYMHVDTCGTSVRVLLVERGVAPASPAPGCVRIDVGRVFAASAVTTFVLDFDGPTVSVHLRQGPAPASWLRGGAERAEKSGLRWGTPTRGLVLFAGAGLFSMTDTATAACGNAPTCTSKTLPPVVSLGAEYWITRFVAAEASYVRPSDVTSQGSGDTYQFDNRLTTRLATVAVKVGYPVKAARIYGLGGMNRLQSTSITTETIATGGGTQTLAQQTEGWNWVAGGGVEAWMTRWVAVYGEFTVAKLKGAPVTGGEGGIDDRAMFGVVGARLRIGR
jgi:hypothetical protein